MRSLYFLLVYVFLCNPANANPLEGNFRVQASFFGSTGALTGDIDVASSNFSLNPVLIYGVSADFITTEILVPGTHTRTYNTTSGGSITRTATIPSGKVGAYFVISHNGNEYQLFNSWNISADGTTFRSINFAGNIFIGGSLNGVRGHSDFIIPPPPPPGLAATITVDNGLVIECNQNGGASTSASVSVSESNGAVLDRVEWRLNDQFINTGLTTAFVAPVGISFLEATAFGVDGITSGTATANIDTRDTTKPDIEIQFLDNSGTVVTSAALGTYQIHFIVTDICDPNPFVASASATPVMNVVEGDQIVINASDDVMLPTTAVSVSATVEDFTGLRATEQNILLISE